MRRIFAGLMALAAIGGTIAYACADGGYESSWDAKQSSAILSPANDTRSNLLLLLADRQGSASANPQSMSKGIVPVEFPWRVLRARLSPPADDGQLSSAYYQGTSEASRCQSNETGGTAFVAAVGAASDIPPQEKQQLIAARQELRPTCEAADAIPYRPLALLSAGGKEFATYLVGAHEFYRGEYGSARSRFRALDRASNGWVRETALYMLARNELNRAQAASFDEYGDLAPVGERDSTAIGDAQRGLDAYLQAYPRGRYAASARGLLRRVAWLKGNDQALGAAYSGLLLEAGARDGDHPSLRLIEEIDVKLLPDGGDRGITDPLLLAVVDLMRLRQVDAAEQSYAGDYRGPMLERAELERQRPIFKSEPALFSYLLAVEAFYGRKQPSEVLALIPDAAHQKNFTYLEFSRQMLRGFALEAVKDRNARGFWLSLFPGANRPYQREAVELALAQHDGAARQAERLFAAGSPIRHPLIRQRILEEYASPNLLRHQVRAGASAHERDVSLYMLLAGELHHGLYADFIRDAALVGGRAQPAEEAYYGGWTVDSYDPIYGDRLGPPPLHFFAAGGSDDLAPCPNIHATAASLAADPAAIRPRLCLAEFIRRKGFDGWNETHDPEYRLVLRARNGFPGNPLQRINVYRSVIASASATADDKAFALNRAIRCFAPTGSSSCGGNDIPLQQRRAWFNQLKRSYPQSAWARDLKHYW